MWYCAKTLSDDANVHGFMGLGYVYYNIYIIYIICIIMLENIRVQTWVKKKKKMFSFLSFLFQTWV